MTPFAVLEEALQRNLSAVASTVTPSPTALEDIRAGIAAKPSLMTRILRLFHSAIRLTKESAVTIPLPMDPLDPTELPLRLLPTDVITRHPETGGPGRWTFIKARDLGLTVLLECLGDDGTDVEFTVARCDPSIHVAPRGRFEDFWGVAL